MQPKISGSPTTSGCILHYISQHAVLGILTHNPMGSRSICHMTDDVTVNSRIQTMETKFEDRRTKRGNKECQGIQSKDRRNQTNNKTMHAKKTRVFQLDTGSPEYTVYEQEGQSSRCQVVPFFYAYCMQVCKDFGGIWNTGVQIWVTELFFSHNALLEAHGHIQKIDGKHVLSCTQSRNSMWSIVVSVMSIILSMACSAFWSIGNKITISSTFSRISPQRIFKCSLHPDKLALQKFCPSRPNSHQQTTSKFIEI